MKASLFGADVVGVPAASGSLQHLLALHVPESLCNICFLPFTPCNLGVLPTDLFQDPLRSHPEPSHPLHILAQNLWGQLNLFHVCEIKSRLPIATPRPLSTAHLLILLS